MGIRERLDERQRKRKQREAEEDEAIRRWAAEWAADHFAERDREREKKRLEYEARQLAARAPYEAKWVGYEARLVAGESHREIVLDLWPALKWIDPELVESLGPDTDLALWPGLNALKEIVASRRSDDAAQLDSRIESPAEQSLWDAYLSSPETRQNIDLIPQYTVDHYRLDFADPARFIAIEVDGLEFHKGQERFIADNQRQRDLQSSGWTVIRFAAKEALGDPDRCLAEIRRMVASQS